MASSNTASENENSLSDVDCTWIRWFTTLRGNEFLAQVPEDFIREKFNLVGLETAVPSYCEGIEIILDLSYENEYGVGPLPIDADDISVVNLYGVIHARYITTTRGIHDMNLKYENGIFGSCPRFYCNQQHALPVGLSDHLGESTVKLYCPCCLDVFEPRRKYAHLDGAFFGMGFPHLFFMTLPHLRPEPPTQRYVPRLYGFKIAEATYRPLPQSPSKSPTLSDPKALQKVENISNI